jgi:hypothetical protein
MQHSSKLGKVLKILIVPEIIIFLYVAFVWLLPFMLNAAVSFSGIK